MYLQFENKQDAETANRQISQNMGLGSLGDVTTAWSDIAETADTKFVILKPEERFVTDVINFQNVESYQLKETDDTV